MAKLDINKINDFLEELREKKDDVIENIQPLIDEVNNKIENLTYEAGDEMYSVKKDVKELERILNEADEDNFESEDSKVEFNENLRWDLEDILEEYEQMRMVLYNLENIGTSGRKVFSLEDLVIDFEELLG